ELVRLALEDETFTHHGLLGARASLTVDDGKIEIPQAAPSMVERSTASMPILKVPINWGRDSGAAVLLLAISDDYGHLPRDLLTELSELLKASELIEKIIYAEKKEDEI